MILILHSECSTHWSPYIPWSEDLHHSGFQKVKPNMADIDIQNLQEGDQFLLHGTTSSAMADSKD